MLILMRTEMYLAKTGKTLKLGQTYAVPQDLPAEDAEQMVAAGFARKVIQAPEEPA
jgi:hypothetical protein